MAASPLDNKHFVPKISSDAIRQEGLVSREKGSLVNGVRAAIAASVLSIASTPAWLYIADAMDGRNKANAMASEAIDASCLKPGKLGEINTNLGPFELNPAKRHMLETLPGCDKGVKLVFADKTGEKSVPASWERDWDAMK